jgi:hypothetical protein
MKKPFWIFVALCLLLCCGACAPAPPEAAPPQSAPLTEAQPAAAEDSAGTEDTADLPDLAAPDAGQAAEADAVTGASSKESSGAEERPEASPEAAGQPVADAQENIAPLAAAGEAVILTISGDGVSGPSTWTLGQLQSLTEGYRELTYSTTNNWPSYGRMSAQGISLPYLLRQATLLESAASFKFTATDGYFVSLTYEQVFGARYAYAVHGPEGSSGALAVEPVLAWAWGEAGLARPENLRPFFGQSGPLEVNTSLFVKDLCQIEVSGAALGVWAAPAPSIAAGSTVPVGTELTLTHENLDSVRIYYTLDGSEPDYNSPVYNHSTSYFQPQLIKPLLLTHSVTVKAFAAAYGKDRSHTVSLSYTVE